MLPTENNGEALRKPIPNVGSERLKRRRSYLKFCFGLDLPFHKYINSGLLLIYLESLCKNKSSPLNLRQNIEKNKKYLACSQLNLVIFHTKFYSARCFKMAPNVGYIQHHEWQIVTLHTLVVEGSAILTLILLICHLTSMRLLEKWDNLAFVDTTEGAVTLVTTNFFVFWAVVDLGEKIFSLQINSEN